VFQFQSSRWDVPIVCLATFASGAIPDTVDKRPVATAHVSKSNVGQVDLQGKMVARDTGIVRYSELTVLSATDKYTLLLVDDKFACI